MLKRIPNWLYVVVGSCLAAAILILTHPKGAIISFDEGFHGGAALFLRQVIHMWLGEPSFVSSPIYLEREFANGITLYPPLWTGLATLLSLIFGPYTSVFRLATSVFYVASILLAYWFIIRNRLSSRTAFVGAAIVATVPMIMIYSHLMMLEVPLLFGVSAMVMGFYLLTMDLIPRTWKTLLLLTLVFILAPLAKLPAILLAWGVIVGFILITSIVYWRSNFYRRFLKPELILFLVVSLLSLYGYIRLTEHFFHTNMIDFFIGQSQGTEKINPIQHALTLAWNNRWFYWRDFAHMPFLGLVWFGSVLVYLLWRRTPLAWLLAIWTVVVYVEFSGVLPQVPQYIMPIYMPLGLATAFLISDLSERVEPKNQQIPLLVAITLWIVISQVVAMQRSEGYGWRAMQVGQEQASAYIAEHAHFGDRVLSWHDGDTYAIRIAGLAKYLQIRNASDQVCPIAMQDSYEWALVVNQPPYISETDKKLLSQAPWQEVKRFGNDNSTILYHNSNAVFPLIIQAEQQAPERTVADSEATLGQAMIIKDTDSQPALWGCLRLPPFGQSTVTFRIKNKGVPSDIADDQDVLRLEYSAWPGGEFSGRNITGGELRHSAGYQDYSFDLNHTHINLPGEFRVIMYRAGTIALDTITVTPQKSNE